MGKLIAKTAAITAGAIVILFALTLLVLSLAFPSTMVSITSGLGMEKSALKYSVKQYERSETLSDLEDLLYRASEAEDYSVLVEYSPKMIDDEGFKAFSDSKPKSSLSYKSYVISNYLYALSKTGETDGNVIQKAQDLYQKHYGTGYEKYNPYYTLVTISADSSNQFKTDLLALLQTVSAEGEELTLLNADIDALTALIND